VVGLSGGIDSALTAVLAVEAVGAEHVHGVAMPSRFSSEHSLADARELAANLGIELRTVPIEDVHRSFEESVRPFFADRPPGVAEENMQARIRGILLMALSNKFGWLLLTTGNKSELAVGYCTLYGDMCGGLAVLSDVPKTVVYELSRMVNRSAGRALIPTRTIEKPPSAELRENQTDQDTLPPYDVLDAILEQYVERDRAVEDIVALGFDRPTVERVARMVESAEHKRKQAPIGLKVTSRAFGTGRRMPIAAKYR
jgi:NAD+ synthetase